MNPEFVCPISLQYFLNPVLASDGNFYEHDEIVYWLTIKNTSPLTNLPITPHIYPSNMMNRLLASFYENNPSALEQRYVEHRLITAEIEKVSEIIKSGEYDRFIRYTKFKVGHFSDFNAFLLGAPDEIMAYVLDNMVELTIPIITKIICTVFSQNPLSRTKAEYLINKDFGFPEAETKKNISIRLCYQGADLEIVKYAFKKGIDFNTTNTGGWTAFHHACRFQSAKVIEWLATSGLDLNKKTLYCREPGDGGVYLPEDLLLHNENIFVKEISYLKFIIQSQR